MKRYIILLLLFAASGYADIHDLSNLPLQVDAGSAASPGVFLNEEGEGETPEGERDGFYDSAEGEDGIGVSVDATSVGKFLSTGWNGNVTGNVTGDVTGDVTGNVTGNLTGDTSGTHFGDVTGGDITADSMAMNEGEGYIYPIAGTTTNPAIVWEEGEGESDGISHSSDSIDFIIDSTEVVTIESDGLHGDVTGDLTGASAGTHTGAISLPDGTEGEPSEYYTSDTNTGRYRIGADEMGWVTNGVLRLRLSTTAFTSTLPFYAPAGSAAAPSYTFAGDPNTGMLNYMANGIGWATDGVQRMTLSSTGTLSITGNFYTDSGGTDASPQYLAETGGVKGGMILDSSGNLGLTRESTRMVDYNAATIGMTRSGAEFAETRTNYYEGVEHNTLRLRGSRGTSASPDYLDDDDVLGRLKFEARDGAGTWGDGAEIRAQAIAAHASGETGTELIFSATEADSDAQTQVAKMGMYRFLPGVLDLDLGFIDSRGLGPLSLSADWLFGYAGDIDANLTGVTVVTWSTGFAGLMLDENGYVTFGNRSAATSAGSDNSWRIGDDGDEGIVHEQYDSNSETWEKHFRVSEVGAEVNSDEAFYLGDPGTDGSWRIIRDGANLVFQVKVSGAWVTKDTITP